ncbi:hypothetical protein [Massilia aerilata]|uniref:Uncharacterized protein n=1 Tax=Massilia aerilata TaxID=453817 RepID=A0ABW0RT51_9BURK
MKPKAHRTQVADSQLELPLGRSGGAHDLAYYIGICKVYAAYHKHWPTVDASREEFRAARVKDVDGRRIQRELRYPAPGLETDPEYQALRERCLLDGMREGVTLEALDPRYRTVLSENGIAGLFASIALPVRAGPDAVRYASGLPAHALEELTLRVGQGIAVRALGLAGFDPRDPRVLARSFAVRVHANDELKSVIDRIGIHRPALDARLADHYLLDAGEDGRLTVRYQLLAGGRYAGRFDLGQLCAKLAAVYALDPELAQLRGAAAFEMPAAPTVPAAPVSGSIEELREQLAMLRAEGRSLVLPIQALSRFADIRRLLEKAGGDYRAHGQRFDFEADIAPAAVLEELLRRGAL